MAKTGKRKAKSILNQTSNEQGFWLHNGDVLHSIEELSMALEGLSTEQLRHHVNKEGNDFSNWIADVLGDKTLATKIKKFKSKKSIQKAVESRLKELRVAAG